MPYNPRYQEMDRMREQIRELRAENRRLRNRLEKTAEIVEISPATNEATTESPIPELDPNKRQKLEVLIDQLVTMGEQLLRGPIVPPASSFPVPPFVTPPAKPLEVAFVDTPLQQELAQAKLSSRTRYANTVNTLEIHNQAKQFILEAYLRGQLNPKDQISPAEKLMQYLHLYRHCMESVKEIFPLTEADMSML